MFGLAFDVDPLFVVLYFVMLGTILYAFWMPWGGARRTFWFIVGAIAGTVLLVPLHELFHAAAALFLGCDASIQITSLFSAYTFSSCPASTPSWAGTYITFSPLLVITFFVAFIAVSPKHTFAGVYKYIKAHPLIYGVLISWVVLSLIYLSQTGGETFTITRVP